MDRSAPIDPTISTPANGSYDTDGGIAFAGSAEANSAVQLLDEGKVQATGTADAYGKWGATLSSVSEGVHDYAATSTDAAGNASTGTAVAVTVDKTVPDTIIKVCPSGFTNDATPSFDFSGAGNLTHSGSLRYSYRLGTSA